MFLKIKNIGKIQSAEIELQGITVIAGNNNTGKSTLGKVLYCVFNAFCNAEDAIREERVNNVSSVIRMLPIERNVGSLLAMKIADTFPSKERGRVKSILQAALDKKIIRNVFGENENNPIDSVVDSIMRSANVSDEDIQKNIFTRFLRTEFNRKVNHVNYSEEGEISISIKERELNTVIKNDECIKYEDNIRILYNALYIDSPFIMDEINRFQRFRFSKYQHKEYLLKCLSNTGKDNSVVDEILIKQKLQTVLSHIKLVVDGEFTEENHELMFKESQFKQPIGFSAISTGMKPFLIIKRLLELGEMKERGVVILDEPEINLHPEWQLKYAELLVLLQKEFNLTILLTTHSPYFLNAIEVYSQKHDTVNSCKYYLASCDTDIAEVRDVTDKTDEIYQQLGDPFHKLETIRHEYTK